MRYDCSGLVTTALRRGGMSPSLLPTGSAEMSQWSRSSAGKLYRLSQANARNMYGAIAVYGGPQGYGPNGHVVFSLGDGRTVESNGSKGVCYSTFDRLDWSDYFYAPGIEYGLAPPPIPPIPTPSPNQPTWKKDDNMLLVRGDKQPAIYRTREDRTEKVWIKDEATLGIDKILQGQLGMRTDIVVWAQGYVDTIPVAGPKPPGYTGV